MRRTVESAIGRRARRVMPSVIVVLYAVGIAIAWQYRDVLRHPIQRRSGACGRDPLPYRVAGASTPRVCAVRTSCVDISAGRPAGLVDVPAQAASGRRRRRSSKRATITPLATIRAMPPMASGLGTEPNTTMPEITAQTVNM